MNYIVLDMEWNQPPHPKRAITKPVVLYGEIIQIGAVRLDGEFNIAEKFKVLIKPRFYKKMNKYVTKVTGLTTEDLEKGLSFYEGVEQFKRWCGKEFSILTWGFDDISTLKDNLAVHGLDSSWITGEYNLQLIFDSQITKTGKQMSLSAAMETVGEPPFDAHDALNDAVSTAKLCSHLDMNKGIEEYNYICASFGLSAAPVSQDNEVKEYGTKSEALKDEYITAFECPLCGTQICCNDIIPQAKDTFISIGKHQNGNEAFVRFKFSKTPEDTYIVCRKVYPLDGERLKYYNKKKKQYAQSKRKFTSRNKKRRTQ